MEETSSSSMSTSDYDDSDFEAPKAKQKKRRTRQGQTRAGTVLHCSKCEYRTILSNHMRWHEERHERKTGHLCPLCSYSLKQKLDIFSHLSKHHSGSERDRILAENNFQLVENNTVDLDEEEDWFYYADGSRTRYIHCGDCDFKSTRYNVESHVRRTHPNSKTALPPPPRKSSKKVLHKCPHCEYSTLKIKELERHDMHHRKKFAHQCSFCSFSSDIWNHVARHAKSYHSSTDHSIHQELEGNDGNSSSKKEEWYINPNGIRTRYQFCSDCGYISTKRKNLEKHVRTMHPLSKTALPPPPSKREQTLHRCTFCQYETPSQRYFDDHQEHHRKKFAHKCHLCSFSAKAPAYLDRHVENHHHRQISGSIYQCPECEYSTGYSRNMKMHEKGHDRDGEFKCSRCNFSAEHEYMVTQHLNRYHRIALTSEKSTNKESSVTKVKVEATSPSGEEMAMNNKRLLKCSLCLYTSNHTGNMAAHEEAHNRNQKYKCTRCSFSSNFKGIVKVHMKRYHQKAGTTPESTASAREEESDDSESSEDDVTISDDDKSSEVTANQVSIKSSSSTSAHMKAHESSHTSNENFRCPLCSFSSILETSLDLHLQDCHTLKERSNIPKNVRSSTATNRKSQVTLHRFFGSATTSPSIKVEIEEEEFTRTDEQPNKDQEANIVDLRHRIQVMRKKVATAQKELRDASFKKREICENMNEIAVKKAKVEHDLRAKQCEALELNIKSLDGEAEQNDVVLAEYSAMCLEDEMKMLEDELQRLREQDANLTEDADGAEGSLIGANQVLQALISELKDLQYD